MRPDPEIARIDLPEQEFSSGRPGWEAYLRLGYSRRGARTVLSERQHRGPLAVQRPFYAEDGLCHTYLLHPPGGIVAGDSLDIDVTLAEGSEVLLTMPAAGKCYRSEDRTATQSVRLAVAEHSALEWLPQETIIYHGARLQSEVRIDLSANASFIGWDMMALGRPSAGEAFGDGFVQADWRLFRSGRPFHIERMRLDAVAVQANWGLQGCSSCASLFALPASAQTLATVRELIGETQGRGVTLIEDMLICRALDRRADKLRAFMQTVWLAIRPEIIKHAGSPPRIWAY